MLINGRALYLGENKIYGMWFDGQMLNNADWILGPISNLEEGKVTYGVLRSAGDMPCPSQTVIWSEYWIHGWKNNENANIQCIS